MEIGQAKLLVGAMRVVIVQAPAEKQCIDTQLLAKFVTIGIEPPLRINTGSCPNASRNARNAACASLLVGEIRYVFAP